MACFSHLTYRQRSAELMDAPGLDTAAHEVALRALMRINAVTDAASLVWKPVERFLRKAVPPAGPTGQPAPAWRMLDIASGAGDLAIAMAYRAGQANFNLAVAGCDLSPTAVRFAQAQAERHRVAVEFFAGNVLSEPLPMGFDILTCSLFLHHLDESDAVALFAAMKAVQPRLIVVQDLRRSTWGYILAAWGSRLLTRSPIVHEDARLSVEGAFTVDELRDLADQAGLQGANITSRWPARMVLTWEASV